MTSKKTPQPDLPQLQFVELGPRQALQLLHLALTTHGCAHLEQHVTPVGGEGDVTHYCHVCGSIRLTDDARARQPGGPGPSPWLRPGWATVFGQLMEAWREATPSFEAAMGGHDGPQN